MKCSHVLFLPCVGHRSDRPKSVDPCEATLAGVIKLLMVAASRLIPVLIVDSMGASLRFYSKILGGVVVYQHPTFGDPAYVTLRVGRFEMALSHIDSSLPVNVPLRPVSGHRIQLCVNVDSVDETVKVLASIGIKTVMEPSDQPRGERAAYVEDPDGNLVLLVAPLWSQ
jgi:lactoylglutathione lyase